MITQKQADTIIASNNLRDAVELLGGTMVTQQVIDSHGKSAKRIIITYNEETRK
tara:strand:+ start:395 stop:556 length:162 start_codon:yes stop_codon:yes gene_type:complete